MAFAGHDKSIIVVQKYHISHRQSLVTAHQLQRPCERVELQVTYGRIEVVASKDPVTNGSTWKQYESFTELIMKVLDAFSGHMATVWTIFCLHSLQAALHVEAA